MNPTRSCIACRRKKDKSQLFRIVARDDKEAIYDKTAKISSRGIYICKDTKCIEKCEKLINKDKLSVKISINNNSLLEVLENLKSELGE